MVVIAHCQYSFPSIPKAIVNSAVPFCISCWTQSAVYLDVCSTMCYCAKHRLSKHMYSRVSVT